MAARSTSPSVGPRQVGEGGLERGRIEAAQVAVAEERLAMPRPRARGRIGPVDQLGDLGGQGSLRLPRIRALAATAASSASISSCERKLKTRR